MTYYNVWVVASQPVGQIVRVQAQSEEHARLLAREEARASDQDDWVPNGKAFDLEAIEALEEQG